MAGVALARVPAADARLVESAFADRLLRAPLIPIAIAFTAGIVADRLFEISLRDSLIASAATLAAWLIAMRGPQRGLALIYLWGSALAFGAAYHHSRIRTSDADDVSQCASLEPAAVVIRGSVYSEPILARPPQSQPLLTFPRPGLTRFTLSLTHLQQPGGWRNVPGLVVVNIGEEVSNIHVGDVVEVAGRLYLPDQPDSPGEFDYSSFLRDQGIRAVLTAQKTPQGLLRLEERWPASLWGWLAMLRAWGQDVFAKATPRTQGVATALLLGEGAAMSEEAWERYYRTSVLHVLAISGQHLVVLAAFLWLGLRAFGVSQRRGALVVATLLMAYALLVGGRPPVLRAAIMVVAWCVALFLGRPLLHANIFAFAWLVVALLNPADVFNTGCQLSFLCVAVLCWGVTRWLHHEPEPIDQLVEQSRSTVARFLFAAGRMIATYYAVTFVVWLAIAPLSAARFHIVSPVALLIGPPMVLLTSIALISGFLLLLCNPLGGPLAWVFGRITELTLMGADALVGGAVEMPGAFFYVPDLPDGWLVLFYVGLGAGLLVQSHVLSGRRLLAGAGVWLALMLGLLALRSAEFRCTFLAVGHGGCTVIETPQGHTLLYDVGAIAGPQVTRRQIAPFLWQRGVRRIDELFISHADLDHFNGLAALLERFSIGRVTCTPSFADRSISGVRVTLDALKRYGVPLRVVKAGDKISHGSITLDVLHPPPHGPEGKENARSMVLRVKFLDHSFLLTGDLEEPGLRTVLSLPSVPTDVLTAPHHGSKASNTQELAKWAQPKLVVSSQGSRFGRSDTPEPYQRIGATFLGTWPDGAITLRVEQGNLVAESFKTKKRVAVSVR